MLIDAGALDTLLACLDRAITEESYLPMLGQIVDATLVAAPRQRNSEGEKAAIKAGKTATEIWPEGARQGQAEGRRCPLKVSKAKSAKDGKPLIDIAIPVFGYKSHIAIDRRHGIIRRGKVTDAAAHDGARLREGLIDQNNTASDVWADSAYRSAENERFLARIGKTSRIHCRKPKGKPMPRRAPTRPSRRSAPPSSTRSPTRRGSWGS